MIRTDRLVSSSRFSIVPIPGYEGYAATSEGRIVKLFEGGAKLAVLSEHFRYGLRVAIVRPDGSETTAPVAKLVALAYHPGGPGDVVFRDGNQRNCHPDNVCWDPDTLPVDPSTVEDLREAPGVPGVYVTAAGEVYSTRSSHGDGLMRKLKCSKVSGGYLIVKVQEGDQRVNQYVHRLVCEAFHGPSRDPNKQNALHRNDVKHDNRMENLYWGSDLDNHLDAVKNKRMTPYGKDGKRGAVHRGEKSHYAKLTEEIVREIRQRNAAGEKYADLARAYNAHPNTIRLICLRQTWTHVE